MAIRLLSVDVDGTITNGRNQVTQATADALRRAAAAGVIVTLNTGRNLCESQMVLDRVPEIRYLMGCTGAFLMDVQQHERLSNHTLDIVTARQVNAIFRKYDTLIGIFYDDLVCNQADEIGQFTRFYPAEMKSVFDTHTVVPSLTATLAAREGGVDKFYVVFADAAAQQAALRAAGLCDERGLHRHGGHGAGREQGRNFAGTGGAIAHPDGRDPRHRRQRKRCRDATDGGRRRGDGQCKGACPRDRGCCRAG